MSDPHRAGPAAVAAAPLSGLVAVVTGAATGIGRAVARRLASDGARVVVNHLDTAQAARRVVDDIVAAGGAGMAFAADVADAGQWAALGTATVEAYGHWDILVNNAAVTTTKPITEFTGGEIDQMLAVNVKGVICGLQLAARQMNDGGRIINISSSTTGLQLTGYSVYDATKAAMDQLTRIVAHELGGRGITVNAVAPGATATETYAAGRGAELVARFAAMSAFNRLGTVEEIAAVVAFLAGHDARWITGQVIRVNGGTV